MGIFDLIKKPFLTNRLKKEQKEQFEQMLSRVVSDLIVTDQEIEEIDGFIDNCELDSKELGNIVTDALMEAVKIAMSDRRISSEELSALEKMCIRLGFSPDFYQNIQREFGIYHLLDQVEKGFLPTIKTNNLILQESEIAHFDMSAFLMEEKVVSKQFVGRSQGVSIRIMKGVSYRVGSSRGNLLTETGFVNVSDGDLVITNRRIVFSGNRKSFNSNLEKILDIRLYKDALQISVSNRQKPVTFGMYSSEQVELAGATISALINQ